jgi:20S proteasome alpha/beta subunit
MEKWMTLALGLKHREGILLATDTLVSSPGYYKFGQSKIRRLDTKSCTAFFALAGRVDTSNRALEIIEGYLNLSEASPAMVRTALDEACLELEDKYHNTESVQMLAGIHIPGFPLEFRQILGAVASPAGSFACIGTGEPLAHFLRSLYPGAKASKGVAVRTAAYILFQAKRHVDGVGGQSQFVDLTTDGFFHDPFSMDGWTYEDLSELEKTLARVDKAHRAIIPKFLDYTINSEQFETALSEIHTEMCQQRKQHFTEIDRVDELMNPPREESDEEEGR